MAFPDSLIENILTAVISGGGTAASAIIAFFRDIKGRLNKVEEKIGSLEAKSGIVYAVYQAELGVNALRTEITSWPNHPPEWLVVLVQRLARRSQSFNDPIEYSEFDQQATRKLERRLSQLEETMEALEKKLSKCVSEEDFEDADHARADDISTIRTTIAEVNGLLKGLQSALGLLKGGGDYRKR